MKLILQSKIGEITAEILPNFKDVILEGIGKASVSYASLRYNSAIVNSISTNPYDVSTQLNLVELINKSGLAVPVKSEFNKQGDLKKVGVYHTYIGEFGDEEESISGFDFNLSNNQKEEIVRSYKNLCERFRQAVRNKEIRIINSGGSLGVDLKKFEGVDTWPMFYHWFCEELGLYDVFEWPKEVRDNWTNKQDVSEDVIKYILKIELENQEKVTQKEQYKQKIFTPVESFTKSEPKKINYDDDFEVVVDIRMKSGNNYSFSCRNIEDFGLAINPKWRKNGGLAIDVEKFIQHNTFSFREETSREEIRSKTTTGWVWSGYNEDWQEMKPEEIEAYLVCEYLTKQYSFMRM